jgi:hypothetical protein|tara:strand:+ start:182 stop:730 length:549 start_codon:yes stop_codon:yes gene_type:complete
MLNLKLNKEIVLKSIKHNQETNLGKRGYADGSQEEQLVGILGENTICNALDLPFMNSEGYDGGFDIKLNGKNVDIKTMGRTVYPQLNYVNNLVAMQLKNNSDIYLFCSYHKHNHELTLCGWIDKENFKKKAKLYKEGDIRYRYDGTTFKTKSDLYEIENRLLNPINNIKDLKQVGLPLNQFI